MGLLRANRKDCECAGMCLICINVPKREMARPDGARSMSRERARYEAIRAAFDELIRAGDPHRADMKKIIGDAFDAGARTQIDGTTDAGLWQTLAAQIPDRTGVVKRSFMRPTREGRMFDGHLPRIFSEFVEQRELVICWIDVEGRAPTLDHALRNDAQRAHRPA
jgi:hypothetical protein